MQEPRFPKNEEERLEAVRACGVLDTEADPAFDQIARLASQIAEAPIALISIIDRHRQWFKSHHGLGVTELSRSVSFCGHAILQPEPMIVHDALQDPRFRDNPLVRADPHIRFYAGIPIGVASGHAIGTLCVIDRRPRTLDGRQMRLLRALARQVEIQVEVQRRVARLANGADEAGAIEAEGSLEVPFRIRLRPDVDIEHLGGAFTALSGYPAERFVEAGAEGAKLLHPEDAPLFAMLLNAPERFERPLLLRWRMADDRYRWLEHETRPVEEDGQLVAIEGVARPPRGTSERDQPGVLSPQALPVAPPDTLAVLAPDGTIRSLSASAAGLLGGDPDAHTGRRLLDLVHPADRARMSGALASADSGRRHEVRLRRADDRFARVEALAHGLGQAQEGGVVVQLRDLSERTRAQEELARREAITQQLALSRQQLADDLRSLQRRSDQVTGLIAHDLKTPLTAIMMNAHLVLEEARSLGRPTSPPRDLLLSADAMQRMIMNLLDVNRGATGGLSPDLREVDVSGIVDHAARRLSVPLEAKQQRLSIENELVDGQVTADPQLLSRVLQNLLDHCSQHAPEGSTLALRLAPRGADGIAVSLSDSGPAVPDAYKARIFDPHARTDPDAAESPRTSRGLGLPFCQLAISAHRGRLWVEDGPTGGNRFCIDLPRHPRRTDRF